MKFWKQLFNRRRKQYKSKALDAHWAVHEASHLITIGDIPGAQKELALADRLLHDAVDIEPPQRYSCI